MRPRRAHSRNSGLTLIEIMIVIAIVGVATGGIALSYRTVQRTQARSAASKLAAGIRYLYDQAIVTGKYYRLVLDFSTDSYRVERADDRFYLVSGKEKGKAGKEGEDPDEEAKKLEEEEERERESQQGIAQQLQPPPRRKRARFEQFKDALLPEIEMSGAFVRDVYTPRQKEPYSEGKAFLYFFPDGHTEASVIHLVSGRRPEEGEDFDEDSRDIYTLIVHPLTGRVELKKGDIEVPRDFDDASAEGDAENAL